MNARLEWHGAEATGKIRAAGWHGIVRATEYFFAQVLAALNISNPPPHNTPSAPGEPPRKRSGFLQGNVQREYDEASLTSRVGIGRNAIYGLFLEVGTRFMLARPWLSATLKRTWGQLSKLALSGKVEGENG